MQPIFSLDEPVAQQGTTKHNKMFSSICREMPQSAQPLFPQGADYVHIAADR
jgi:hypothetical protein